MPTDAHSPAPQDQPLDAAGRAAMERAYDAADAGNAEAAMGLCETVLARLPHAFAPHYLLGTLLARRSRIEAARDHLGTAVALRPNSTVALFNLGLVLLEGHAFEEGLAVLRRAHAQDAGDPGIAAALVTAMAWAGEPEEAARLGAAALARWPGHLDLRVALAKAHDARRDQAAALAVLDEGLAANPAQPALLGRKARILMQQEALDAAAAAADAALAADPRAFDALLVRGSLASKAKRYTAAQEVLRSVLALKPNSLSARIESISARIHSCDWPNLDRLADEIEPWLGRGLSPVAMFEALMVFDDPALLQRIARTTIAAGARRPVEPAAPPPAAPAGERIRVGYLSSAFRNHASAANMGDMFRCHDRSRFEVIAFSTHPDDGSALRAQFRRDFDCFHDIEDLADEAAARFILDARLDVLVDRDGATGAGRVNLVKRRLAPVQVNFVGYPGTIGHAAWDYIVADPTIIPPESDRFYDEAVVRMPDCYVATSQRAVAAELPGRAACGLPDTGFVFCAFNDPKKITASYFDVWMRLLKAVAGAVVWIVDGGADATLNLRKAAAARGVDPARVVVAPRVPLDCHMARHAHADLFLDTGPFNGHTTGSDALFMGVPLITCIGSSFHARVAASLLKAHGLAELVTETLADYEALALALARDPARLAQLKARVRANQATHPLFATARYVRHLEAAFAHMIARQRAGLAPESFDVAKLV
jgi:predicted O-linked N-acetylglucosamine transferase (SPINDLY family)